MEAAMSAFRDLLASAHALGARSIRFEVDLDAFFRDEQAESWWSWENCYGDLPPRREPIAVGRTGEEALRRLVAKLTVDP